MNGERPVPRHDGVNDREAVELCREWMIYLGEASTVTAVGAVSAFCDLYSSRYIALIDSRRGNIGLPLVDRAAVVGDAGNGPILPILDTSPRVVPSGLHHITLSNPGLDTLRR